MIRLSRVRIPAAPNCPIDELSFAAGAGEAWAIVGAGGCGKGTLVAAVAGAVAFDRGDILVAGRSMRHEPQAARRACGFAPADLGILPALRADDFLDVYGATAGLAGAELEVSRRRALDLAGLRGPERIDRIPGGAVKRLLLGRAVIHDPPVLALDDPFRGLDPHERVLCERLVESAVLVDRTVIAAIDDSVVPACFTHVALLDRGNLLAAGPNHPAAFAPGHTWTWRVTVPRAALSARERLADLVPEAHVIDDHTVDCRIDPALTPPATLVTALVRAGNAVETAGYHPPWTAQLVPRRGVPGPGTVD